MSNATQNSVYMRIYWNLFKQRNLHFSPLQDLNFFFFLCMCIYLYTFTHTESFSDFHSLLGDLHLLRGSTSSLEVLIPDLNQGRENAKYYIPENRVVVLFWLWQTVIKMLISVCFNKISQKNCKTRVAGSVCEAIKKI